MVWSLFMWKKIKNLFLINEQELIEDNERAMYLAQYISINHREDDYGL